jgi:Ras-related protein Rab-1A
MKSIIKTKHDHNIKILIVGDSRVGKSSIIKKYVDDIFNHQCEGTIGVDFKTKYVNSGKYVIKVQIWDLSGQRRFDTLIKTFYRGSNFIILCFDVTNRLSFDNIARWLNSISTECENETPALILGLKIDLDSDRKVSYDEGLELAKKNSVEYKEVSSLIHSQQFIEETVFKKIVDDTVKYYIDNGYIQNNNNNYDTKKEEKNYINESIIDDCCVLL